MELKSQVNYLFLKLLLYNDGQIYVVPFSSVFYFMKTSMELL